MVSVEMKKGLNILYLKSLEENGAPNLDQIAFDVEGIVLFEDSTQLSSIDTLGNEAVDSNKVDTVTVADKGKDDSTGKNNVKPNGTQAISQGFINTRGLGPVQLKIFDMNGHLVSSESGNLSTGVYMVQFKANGRTMQKNQMNLKRNR
jgi:rhamnogalacturonan endolyase